MALAAYGGHGGGAAAEGQAPEPARRVGPGEAAIPLDGLR